MTTNLLTLHEGDVGADFTQLTVTVERWLQQNGAKWTEQYVARTSRIGKVVTPERRDRTFTLGLGLGLVYEGSIDDIDGGGEAGVRNGQFAADFAYHLGYPANVGLPVTACADKDVYPSWITSGSDPQNPVLHPGNLDRAVEYALGFRQGLAAAYELGGYWDANLGAAVPCVKWTKPGAAFWDRVDPHDPQRLTPDPHIDQRGVNQAIDRLTARKPIQVWCLGANDPPLHPAATPVPPTPVPTPDPVPTPPPPPIVVTPPADPCVGIWLHRPATGKAVLDVQKRLAALGLYTRRQDGVFGWYTAAAVKNFQKHHGLKQDGIVGPATCHELGKVKL